MRREDAQQHTGGDVVDFVPAWGSNHPHWVQDAVGIWAHEHGPQTSDVERTVGGSAWMGPKASSLSSRLLCRRMQGDPLLTTA